jgi:hypothetical protein
MPEEKTPGTRQAEAGSLVVRCGRISGSTALACGIARYCQGSQLLCDRRPHPLFGAGRAAKRSPGQAPPWPLGYPHLAHCTPAFRSKPAILWDG